MNKNNYEYEILKPYQILSIFKKNSSALKEINFHVRRLDNLTQEITRLRLDMSRSRLESLHNKFQNERCFILGNGPSLTLQDVDKLKNEYTFASNKIFLLFDQTDWRPTFYSVEDHLVLSQNISEIEAVKADYKLFPDYPLNVAPSFLNSLYFPLKYVDLYPNSPEFSFDMIEGLHWGSSIVYTQMQIACYLGFKEIYLIGVDYSYLEPSLKEGKILTCEGEVNHFHKDYRRPGEKWYVPNLNYHEKSFTKAREVTDANDIKIYNATRGGKLEIFPRKDFDSLF